MGKRNRKLDLFFVSKNELGRDGRRVFKQVTKESSTSDSKS